MAKWVKGWTHDHKIVSSNISPVTLTKRNEEVINCSAMGNRCSIIYNVYMQFICTNIRSAGRGLDGNTSLRLMDGNLASYSSYVSGTNRTVIFLMTGPSI